MRILIINHSPLIGSGSGIYTMNLAKSLKKAEENVKVITAANSLDFPTLDGIEVHPIYFKNNYEAENVIDFNVPCFDKYPTSDVVFYNLTKEQIKEYIEAFRIVLEQEIKEFKPDIIHTQHLWIWSSIVPEYNIPTIVTSHGSDMMGYDIDNSFYPYCIKAIQGCKKIITISKKNNEIVVDRFPKAKEKVVTMKNGYDSSVFYLTNFNKSKVLKEYGINKEYKKIVLFAGRLTENKGIDVLLEAAKEYEDGNILTLIAGGRRTITRSTVSSKRSRFERCCFFRRSNTRKLK